MRTLIVIPARLGSWRFPNKPLTQILGLPMIEHVYRRSCMTSNSARVVLAICEGRLEETCKRLQMDYVMTDQKQPTALDRVGEAASLLGYTNYEDIVMKIEKLTDSKHHELLEDLAENIFNIIFKNKLVKKINLKLEKLDILKKTKSVGIKVSKTKI